MQTVIPLPPGQAFEPGPDLTLGMMFADAALVIKVIMALLIFATIAAIALAVRKSMSKGPVERSPFISNLRLAGPLLGLLGATYGLMNSMIGVTNTATTNLAVIAPGLAEAALAAALGLLAGSVACAANWAIEARPPVRREPSAPTTRVIATS